MKDYKLLLAGLILLLILFIAIFTWLWINNRKEIDPLPLMANENEPKVITKDSDENPFANINLYIQAEQSLQTALDDVILRFESRYPHIKVVASYVPSHALLTLSDITSSHNKNSDFVAGTDMIIANESLSAERLAPLQAELKAAQDKINQNKTNTSQAIEDDEAQAINDETGAAKTYYTEARTLNSYNYALKDEQTLEGVILTNNTAAINFRNFLLSSTGQDILEEYGYHNIEGYQNSVDDLFNPASQSKITSDEGSLDVTEALSNGKV